MPEFSFRDITAWKYQLLEDYWVSIPLFPELPVEARFIYLNLAGRLTILKGYCWDGTSGPTIDTKTNMRASLIHDALYQGMREGWLPQDMREEADQVFRDICLEDGMWPIRAAIDFKGLQWFGARHARLQRS